MRRFSVATSILLALGLPTMAVADVSKQGAEFQVNTFTSGDQENPRVGTDSVGNFVVAWTSTRVDSNNDGVAVQRFNRFGTKVGTEFVANTYTTYDQGVPDVAVQPNGNFVVVWQSSLQDGDHAGIFGQRFNSSGAAVGTEFQINTFTSGNQENPAVAVDPAGDFVAVWEGPTAADDDGIFGQRFDSTGAMVGTEFTASTLDSNDKEKAAVKMDTAGNFIVAWENHNFDGNQEGVAVQRYDSTGAPVGTEFQVNTYTTDAQEHTRLAIDKNGNFVVVWDSYTQDGSAEGVYGQRFNSSGVAVGTEFRANTYTTNEQEDPDVAYDSDGNFVVVWYSGPNGPSYPASQDGSADGAFGQRFSNTGARIGTEFQINTTTSDNQTDPKVATQPGGNFIIVWQSFDQDGSGEGVFAQRFGPPFERVPAVGFGNLTFLGLILLVVGGAALARQQHRRG